MIDTLSLYIVYFTNKQATLLKFVAKGPPLLNSPSKFNLQPLFMLIYLFIKKLLNGVSS
jgi:hypothetical protein